MPGTFHGLTNMQWELIKPLIPARTCKIGRPPPDFRKILNTILYVNITGCRWCDVPIGSDWAKRSTAHDWLGILTEKNVWDQIRHAILCMADLAKQIDWEKGAIDGSFSPRERLYSSFLLLSMEVLLKKSRRVCSLILSILCLSMGGYASDYQNLTVTCIRTRNKGKQKNNP